MTKKTPKIRFQNHSEGWELKKLNELVERVTRKNTKLESTLPLTISALDGLVDQETYFKKKVASRDVSNYYLLNKGEFAYNKSYSNGYPLGAVKRLDLYEQGVLSTLYIAFNPINIDSDFLVSYYDTNKWHKEVIKRASEGARNHGLLNISPTDFFDTELAIPINIHEQKKIGSLFKELDESIKLNQHALNLLKQRKKAFLQKMFPRKGESEPKVRFSEFTEKWKPCSLGELSEGFEYGLNASAKKYDGENKYLRITDIDEETRRFLKSKITSPNFDLEEADNYLLKEGDLLFARTGASVGKTYLYNTNDGKVYYAGFLVRARLKSTVDPSFIFQNTFTQQYYNYVQITSQRSGQPGINAKEYSKFKLKIPSLLEQQKIGNFFKELDNSITLQEEKIESLKQMKKAFLQKMFV